MEILSLFNFILSNSLIILASKSLYFYLTKNDQNPSKGKTIISVFTIYISTIILIEIFLGIFGLLFYPHVSTFSYIISLSILYFTKNTKPIPQKETILPSIFSIIVFTPLIIILVLRAFNALLQIPIEYDSLAYHLPFMVEWLNSGSLTQIYYSAFASPIGYYPSNHELLDLWLVLPFKNDFLINLINFPIMIIFAISMLEIQKTLNIKKHIRILITASLLYTPIFLRQAGLPLVDIFFSTTFCIAIYYLIQSHKQKHNITNLVFFGLSIGLFIGTKYLGIIYAIPLILLFLLTIVFDKKVLKKLGITVFFMFLTGSFFYIRNYINSGNPLFPTEITLFGKKIFEGYLNMNEKLSNTSIIKNIKSYTDIKYIYETYFNMTGINIKVYILLLFPFFSLTFFKKFKTEKSIIISLLLLNLTYIFLYIISPYSYRDITPNIRYSMMFLIIISISAAFFINKLKKPWYLLIIIGIAETFYSLILFPADYILYNDSFSIDLNSIYSNKIEFILFILLIFSIYIYFKNYKYLKILTITSIIVLTFILSNFSINNRQSYSKYFYTKWYTEDQKIKNLFDAFSWINEKTSAKKIAYTGFNFHYPLFGQKLDREVDYININDCKNCRYIDYKNSPNSIRTNPDKQAWLNNLKNKKKEYIILSSSFLPELTPYEKEWILEEPEIFKLTYNNDFTEIYKILPLP